MVVVARASAVLWIIQWGVEAKLMDRSDCGKNPLYATSTFPATCSCLVRLGRPIWVIRINIIRFSVQRITRYPLLIKQILQYTEPGQDRELTERALHTAERTLDAINEAIRGQEGLDRPRVRVANSSVGFTRAYL